MLVFEDQFAFVPFIKPQAGLEDLFTGAQGDADADGEEEGGVDVVGEEAGLLNGTMLGTPFVRSLEQLGMQGFVRDYAFLHVYMTPTVAILAVRHARCRSGLSRRGGGEVAVVLTASPIGPVPVVCHVAGGWRVVHGTPRVRQPHVPAESSLCGTRRPVGHNSVGTWYTVCMWRALGSPRPRVQHGDGA